MAACGGRSRVPVGRCDWGGDTQQTQRRARAYLVNRRVAEASPGSHGRGLVEAAMRTRFTPDDDPRMRIVAVEEPVAIHI